MLRGQLPAAGVLERLGLPQYAPLAEAVRSGALRGLNRALLADQHRFIMEARSRQPSCWNKASVYVSAPPVEACSLVDPQLFSHYSCLPSL